MKSFTVKMSNSYTGKNKTRVVDAPSAWEAERKARSNSMMANGWFTDEISVDGVVVSIYE